MEKRRLIIIGSGAAGWTAAIYAARAGLKPLVITGMQSGGQMTIAGEVENFPGFDSAIDGPDLMDKMAAQAIKYGTEVESDTIVEVDFGSRPYVLTGEMKVYSAESVIIATGATARWLFVEGEQNYMGRGVSACATCDGYFFRGREVAVIGGGNTAVEEALLLAGLCKTVHFVHRRKELRAERILQQRLAKLKNIVFHWDTVLTSVNGGDGVMDPVTSITLESIHENNALTLPVDGVFVAIGHDPATAPFIGKIDLDANGYIVVNPSTFETNIPGVFAAGDVADPVYRQAVTAAGMGCMAALNVEKWLSEHE